MKRSLILLFFISFMTLCQARDKGAPPKDAVPEKWDFALEYFNYIASENISEGTFYADHGDLHLEARYNYEDINTLSVFAGKRYTFGKTGEYNFVPMAGVLFGNTEGVAPGIILNFSWGKLNLYSENEYIFDYSGKQNDFFYTWTELILSPTKWFHFGFVLQKFQLIQTPYIAQTGINLGFDVKNISVNGYIFNVTKDSSYSILSFDINF
jgi:hypothetical protein